MKPQDLATLKKLAQDALPALKADKRDFMLNVELMKALMLFRLAAQPDTVLAMIEEIERLQNKAKRWQDRAALND